MNKNTKPCPKTPGRFVGSGSRREYINSRRTSLFPASSSPRRNDPHFSLSNATPASSTIAGRPPLTYRTSGKSPACVSSNAARKAWLSDVSYTPEDPAEGLFGETSRSPPFVSTTTTVFAPAATFAARASSTKRGLRTLSPPLMETA